MEEFEQAYELYFGQVYRFLLRLSGDEHMADELTQEVFFKALLHMDRYRDQGTMVTWLCTIGKNLWLSECRRHKKFSDPEPDFPDPAPGPEEQAIALEQQRLLRKAVLELPEEYRDVVLLHIYAGLPLRDIAAQRGKSESWGKVTFYRAKQILIKKLEGSL